MNCINLIVNLENDGVIEARLHFVTFMYLTSSAGQTWCICPSKKLKGEFHLKTEGYQSESFEAMTFSCDAEEITIPKSLYKGDWEKTLDWSKEPSYYEEKGLNRLYAMCQNMADQLENVIDSLPDGYAQTLLLGAQNLLHQAFKNMYREGKIGNLPIILSCHD